MNTKIILIPSFLVLLLLIFLVSQQFYFSYKCKQTCSPYKFEYYLNKTCVCVIETKEETFKVIPPSWK
ncbi:MAG: hypothetical protein NZ942_03655 [Candidatus Aenigmarchaeota archaeon]|nr:hypothetical protein [Candidatus Aenigmarchaeota archaeon]